MDDDIYQSMKRGLEQAVEMTQPSKEQIQAALDAYNRPLKEYSNEDLIADHGNTILAVLQSALEQRGKE